jgi:hypothetical protein
MNPHGLRYFGCTRCGLVRISSRPTRDQIGKIYESSRLKASDSTGYTSTITQRATEYWRHLKNAIRTEPSASRVLLAASDPKPMLQTGPGMGFHNITACSDLVNNIQDSGFDAAVVVFALERGMDPKAMLQSLHTVIKPDGVLLLVMPMLDSWAARFFRDFWTELRPENIFHFDSQNIQSLLLDCGYQKISLRPDRPRYTLYHIYSRSCTYPRTLLTKCIRRLLSIFPLSLMRSIRMRGPSSASVIVCRKASPPSRKKLSIVMPAFNERATFQECFARVLDKNIRQVDKEIIVVESNSTDGTRELVRQICDRPGVSLILQDKPRGKGNAVRAGLQAARGDIVLIQDADLEYDVEDYDALLEPILNKQAAFVLGSRHAGAWKIRKFNDQKLSTFYFNTGHVLFRGLMNLLYRQSMKDPFTMYKVFRTDCLHGLKLECNRFDFDIEIVIKLVRKGYKPLEIPVNYRARSFEEGKKVSAFRDPFTWLWAIAKYRFCKIAFPGPDSWKDS